MAVKKRPQRRKERMASGNVNQQEEMSEEKLSQRIASIVENG